MFLALKKPFPEGVVNLDPNVVSCLAFRGRGGIRMIIGSLAAPPDPYLERYECLAECFNAPLPLEFKKLMLRSIRDTYTRGALQRAQLERSIGSSPGYYRDGPGQGGSGFDSYW